ncbi:MAG: hypothetical protein KTR33_05185 [Gammaproteobacteria bacterium]|nr:hypothetical protein [Gammaproteobacteria bacterium]
MSFLDFSHLPAWDVSGLTVAYIMLCALLLSLNLFSSWNWFVKVAANALVIFFFAVTYHSWPGILGWPTARDLPQSFYLHAVNVDEPHSIYLWGADLDHGLGRTVPRAYSVPYSARLHDRVDKATRKLRKGLPVIGQVKSATPTNTDLSPQEQTQASDTDIVFIDAPQALIPGKN